MCGSQKGLMVPPGLGFNAVSEKALRGQQDARSCRRRYWDWQEMLKQNRAGFFPYTPATNLLYGLREALQMLHEEGLAERASRATTVTREATRAAVRAWGLEIVCEDPREYSSSMTAVFMPEGHNADRLRQIILEHFDMSLGTGLQARRQGVPHRPSRQLQRPDAGGHAQRRRDGPAPRGRAASRRAACMAALDIARRRRSEATAAPAESVTPLPLSSHGKPVDTFAQAAELERELRRDVRGEVRFDRGSRALYATDGSNYRQVPIGLVVPRDADDVVAAVAACRAVRRAGAAARRRHQPRRPVLQRRRRARLHEVHEPDPRDRSGRAVRARPAGRRARHAAQRAPSSISSRSAPIRRRTAAARSAA